ncbi:MAG: agmatine deiminase family protein [Flavobacteriales bacterium]|nr:Peptidylarginine deiminase [Flavobacteriales bacterium]MCC6577660.1 agmatine deiminase family protein [Flavobacteriales bacterium]NUQ16758.1 agmatine deiminase family protein [Flavobacteriales bacterium]
MLRRLLLPAALLAPAFVLVAQKQTPLPHTLAPHEHALIRDYRDSRATDGRGITTPPPGPVRTMAEWEEIQSLVLCWAQYEGILKQIVRHAKQECEVIIVCDDAADVTAYLNNSQYGGPLDNLDNITLVEGPYNSIWSRDYFAESIYLNEVDSLFLLDWIYNRPRPLDDAMSDLVGGFKGIPVYGTTAAPNDLVHTGGNFMCDGFGTAFSSWLVMDENGPNGQFNQTVKNEAQVDAIMNTWMGIQPGRYIKMPTLPYDNIHHIDMHMKLLDEEHLLVGEFPLGLSDGPQIESNLDDVTATYNSVFGTPYEVIRVPMPPSTGGNYPPDASYRTYANNVFINGTVLVPTYRTAYDTVGLRILQESLPGYKVVGIDCDDQGLNIISASGAIHCITKGIGVSDPLLIRHQRLDDTYETVDPYAVEAYIRHRTGIASAQLYWTVDTAAGFAAVPLTDQGGDVWAGAIPAQPVGTRIFYYIEATANSGKVQVRPLVAPAGWWSFRVLDANTAVNPVEGPSFAALYPNPATAIVVVGVEAGCDERVELRLLDATGRLVRTLFHGRVPPDGRLFVDVAALPVGVYRLELLGAAGRSTRGLLKQ